MPVLNQERVSTRSALRYRPLPVADQAQPGPIAARRSRARPDASAVATKGAPDDLDLEEAEEDQPPRRRSAAPAPRRKAMPPPPAQTRRRLHPLFFLGIGLLAFGLLWWGMEQALIWGNNELNTLRYGYPRTFQVDAVVGHQDSARNPSHFEAINLHGQIEVIEWPGGNAAQARIYVGPQIGGPDNDLAPVTVRFVDLNGDGKPDMVMTAIGEQIVFINDQGSFRPMRPDEQGPVMQRLRQIQLGQ